MRGVTQPAQARQSRRALIVLVLHATLALGLAIVLVFMLTVREPRPSLIVLACFLLLVELTQFAWGLQRLRRVAKGS